MRLVIGGAYQGNCTGSYSRRDTHPPTLHIHWRMHSGNRSSPPCIWRSASCWKRGGSPCGKLKRFCRRIPPSPSSATRLDAAWCRWTPLSGHGARKQAHLLHAGGKGCARRPGLLWDCHLPQTGGNPMTAWLFLLPLPLGFLLDLCFGDPHWMPHPVRAIGWLIARLERLLCGLFPNAQRGAFGGRFSGDIGSSLHQRDGDYALVGAYAVHPGLGLF